MAILFHLLKPRETRCYSTHNGIRFVRRNFFYLWQIPRNFVLVGSSSHSDRSRSHCKIYTPKLVANEATTREWSS